MNPAAGMDFAKPGADESIVYQRCAPVISSARSVPIDSSASLASQLAIALKQASELQKQLDEITVAIEAATSLTRSGMPSPAR